MVVASSRVDVSLVEARSVHEERQLVKGLDIIIYAFQNGIELLQPVFIFRVEIFAAFALCSRLRVVAAHQRLFG
jgi:hypothetical protein